MNRARAFYESMLATRLAKMESPIPGMEMWTFPWQENGTGASGALIKMEGCLSGGVGTLVYFACVDCGVEAKRAAANGGRIFKDKFSIGKYGFIALLDRYGKHVEAVRNSLNPNLNGEVT
jgi:predicted enzyme related to lactoylglutathione lyase